MRTPLFRSHGKIGKKKGALAQVREVLEKEGEEARATGREQGAARKAAAPEAAPEEQRAV